MSSLPPRVTGISPGGMPYAKFGDGPRMLLIIPGGPGSAISDGSVARIQAARSLRPYLDAGFTVWTVARRRGMPTGHSISDIADDHAEFVRDQLGGHVDVVLGESFGGLVALHLAAHHPALADRYVLAGSAARVTAWCADIDRRFVARHREGRTTEAAATLLEYAVTVPPTSGARSLAGWAVAAAIARLDVPLEDMVVEAEAEAACDARSLLPRIASPVLMVTGDQDQFFPPDIVRETAGAISDVTVRTYPGIGHIRLFGDPRLPRDILAWL